MIITSDRGWGRALWPQWYAQQQAALSRAAFASGGSFNSTQPNINTTTMNKIHSTASYVYSLMQHSFRSYLLRDIFRTLPRSIDHTPFLYSCSSRMLSYSRCEFTHAGQKRSCMHVYLVNASNFALHFSSKLWEGIFSKYLLTIWQRSSPTLHYFTENSDCNMITYLTHDIIIRPTNQPSAIWEWRKFMRKQWTLNEYSGINMPIFCRNAVRCFMFPLSADSIPPYIVWMHASNLNRVSLSPRWKGGWINTMAVSGSDGGGVTALRIPKI